MYKSLNKLCGEETLNFLEIKKLICEAVDIRDSTSLLILSQNQTAYKDCKFLKIVKLLIHHGVNVNFIDDHNRNALHYLCWHYIKDDLPEIIKLLIKNGIDISLQDCTEHNAGFFLIQNIGLDIAVFVKVVKILVRHGISL